MSPGETPEDSFKDLELAFYNDGYHLALETVIAGENNSLLDAVAELYRVLDDFLDTFLANAERSNNPAHCIKGCSWCCHQAVYAQAHEIRFLKRWMYRNLSHEAIEAIRTRAKKKWSRTGSLSEEQRLSCKVACPFLIEGTCVAYDSRPVACRIYLSGDRESCRIEFESPLDKTSFPKLYELPLRAGRKLNEGFAARISEIGFPVVEYPLEAGVLT